MQIRAEARELHLGGIQASASFAISRKDEAHIMQILRDTLYTDKVSAVLREYTSNAWDAHREVGKHNVPIRVVLPTQMEPPLIIRDFGTGLSEFDVFNVYTQYGASTKRDSDECVGMLGIGSKAGFAYSDQFMITSHYEGMKTVYSAVIDSSNRGQIHKLSEFPCGDETGIEIRIPVKPRDIREFHFKAVDLLKYMEPQPEINTELPLSPKFKNSDGFLSVDGCGWVAVMGCVPYRISLDQILYDLSDDGGVTVSNLRGMSGALRFDIGEVQVSANREELKYSTLTKQALCQKFNQLISAYVEESLQALQSSDMTEWAKRLYIRKVSEQLRLPLPASCREYGQHVVNLWGVSDPEKPPPRTFTLLQGNDAVRGISVAPHTVLYLRDEAKPIAGYQLRWNAIVVKPVGSATISEVLDELNGYLSRHLLTGIPVEKLSSCPWTENAKGIRVPNAKHSVRTFVLVSGKSQFCFPWSSAWSIEDHEPADEDVYVVLSHFIPEDMADFFDVYEKDRDLCVTLGVEMPPIYGYKTTEKKPVVQESLKGTPYRRWRENYFVSLMTPERLVPLQALKWKTLLSEEDWRLDAIRRNIPPTAERLVTVLGQKHPLTQFFEGYTAGTKEARSIPPALSASLRYLLQETKTQLVYDAERLLQTVYKRYPVLKIGGGFTALADQHFDTWIEYIKLVDHSHTEDSR